MTPLILTRREAAKALGIGVQSLNTLLRRGEIAQVDIGRQKRITRASIEAFATRPAEAKTFDELLNEWRAQM